MQIVVDVPDGLAKRLGVPPAALPEAAVRALAIDAYRCGQLTEWELGELLQLQTRDALDALLKQHGVPLKYTWDDLETERATLRRLLTPNPSTGHL